MGDAQRLLQAIPLESYIGRYVSLKRRGRNLWGLCPFHREKTPSFAVSPERGIFKCFGCGKGGNLITFVQLYENVDFPAALRILADFAGIKLSSFAFETPTQDSERKEILALLEWVKEEYRQALVGSPAQEYLRQRGVSQDAISHFEMGYAPSESRFLEKRLAQRFGNNSSLWQKNYEYLRKLGLIRENQEDSTSYNHFWDRLIFPIKDLSGKTIAFGGRIISEKENVGKYINSPESKVFQKKNSLFHLYEARDEIRKAGQAVLVEGYFDVVGLWEKKIANVVAPLGTAFTLEQAKTLKRYTNRVLFFFDQDAAGFGAALRSLKITRQLGLEGRVVVLQDAQAKIDPFDLSRTKNYEEILLFLDKAWEEREFVLWYFFKYRYNISKLAEKKQALLAFLEYVADLENEIEKEEYLRAASDELDSSLEVLKQEFRRRQKLSQETKVAQTSSKEKPYFNDERILLFLLHFPFLLAETTLLEQYEPSTEEARKLFAYLKDRFQAGQPVSLRDGPELTLVFTSQTMLAFLAQLALSELNDDLEAKHQLEPSEIRNLFLNEVLLIQKQKLERKLQKIQQELVYKNNEEDLALVQEIVSKIQKIDRTLRSSRAI
ncbi:MAG: DNA primase [Leptospiraceae bacterium]|nr:DNA primase [Leptospiraceae bacterium]MDW8306711.1 DNA primase [Leptospiraceae bacterium]